MLEKDQKYCYFCKKPICYELWETGVIHCEECVEVNWLDSREIYCQHCNQRLAWVIHSPFIDGLYYYCTKCPKRVDVCYYDPIAKQIRDKATENNNMDWDKYHIMIENQLLPCSCSGQYKYKAARRCLYCSFEIEGSSSDRDVYFMDDAISLSEKGLIVEEKKWKEST